MAIFDTALQYIIDDTGRPELADVAKRRIQRTVLKLHRVDFFKKDLIEQIHAFQYTQAVQNLNEALYPRLRAIGYIRKFDTSAPANSDPSLFSGFAGDFFKEVNPQMAMDGYGFDKQNTMYRASGSIRLNSSEAINRVLFAWFRDPIIEPIEVCDSWILQYYPNLVACDVKKRIFKDIGKDEESRSSKEEYDEEFMTFLANNIRLAILQQPGE